MSSDRVIVFGKMDLASSAAFSASLTYESAADLVDFPQTEEPVWILGEQYSTLYDLDDIRHDVLSRLWFTYRKGFSPIGGTGPTYDTGWGCMLRCGQMMVAQALLNRHLGRKWRWRPKSYDPKYHEILHMFQDMKMCCYSIHQIASMGVSEGKQVGQWFGPNTIAQVLKKLCVYDDWSRMVIHVAMDNTVIIDDIRMLCRCRPKETMDDISLASTTAKTKLMTSSLVNGAPSDASNIPDGDVSSSNGSSSLTGWKPLLLLIPLRLGLSEINPVYIPSLKTCLSMRQSVGVIGGKPNHALWFIGHVGDDVIYLDPHTTQPFVDLKKETDESFHCAYASRMRFTNLDPSVAAGFYCGSEAEFDDLCQSIKKHIVQSHRTAMFELHQERPRHWPPFEPFPRPSGTNTDFTVVEDRQYDTDEEFELL